MQPRVRNENLPSRSTPSSPVGGQLDILARSLETFFAVYTRIELLEI